MDALSYLTPSPTGLGVSDLVALRSRLSHLAQYGLAEDYFGPLGDDAATQAATLKQRYRELIARAHPDRFCAQGWLAQNLAEEVAALIHRLRTVAEEKIASGTYGQRAEPRSQFVVTSAKHAYRVSSQLARGDYAIVYQARCHDRDVCLKMVNHPDDNDLMDFEAEVLRQTQHKSLPSWVERFNSSDGRRVHVMEYIDGVDFRTLRELYPSGVPTTHALWIFERLLSVLGYLHSQRILHGNIEPGNILVRPSDHNAFLIDFLFSLKSPGPTSAPRGGTEYFSAPEIFERKPPIPPSDLYSLGKCMLFLLGGDVRTNRLPPHLDARLCGFLRRFLEPQPLQRERDAWEACRRLSELRLQMCGARHQFLPFTLPLGTARVQQVV